MKITGGQGHDRVDQDMTGTIHIHKNGITLIYTVTIINIYAYI